MRERALRSREAQQGLLLCPHALLRDWLGQGCTWTTQGRD